MCPAFLGCSTMLALRHRYTMTGWNDVPHISGAVGLSLVAETKKFAI